jgi:hypothetical protein
MMCVMHQAEPYGYLVLNGNPIEPPQLARMVGASERETSRWIAELRAAGVFSVDDVGQAFSRRMVRDEDLRNRRANGGSAGAEYGIKGKEHGSKGGRPRNESGVTQPPLNPPPSSSVFSLQSSASKDSKSKAPRRPVELPEWLPTDQWEAYLDMRQRIRKPATAYAQTMAIAKLRELREQGEHPAAVLGQSIMNSWQGIFPLKNGAKS